MKAIVVGATGATGIELVKQLLVDDDFHVVEVFIRREWDIQHPKLVTHVVDFEHIDSWKHLIMGDAAFCCLGSTLKQAGSREALSKIDYSYPMQFAQNCKGNGVTTFVLMSSLGANYRSKIYYSKLKGSIERVILNLHFDQAIIVRPSVLIRPNSNRFGEKVAIKVISFLNRLHMFLKYKPVTVSIVAKRMREEVKVGGYRVNLIESNEM